MDRSKFYYIEYTPSQDVHIDKQYLEEHFELANENNILLMEVDNLYDSIFFEQCV